MALGGALASCDRSRPGTQPEIRSPTTRDERLAVGDSRGRRHSCRWPAAPSDDHHTAAKLLWPNLLESVGSIHTTRNNSRPDLLFAAGEHPGRADARRALRDLRNHGQALVRASDLRRVLTCLGACVKASGSMSLVTASREEVPPLRLAGRAAAIRARLLTPFDAEGRPPPPTAHAPRDMTSFDRIQSRSCGAIRLLVP
jgi:hypothetical protein